MRPLARDKTPLLIAPDATYTYVPDNTGLKPRVLKDIDPHRRRLVERKETITCRGPGRF